MSACHYHKRYHSDALSGFMSLTLEERGAYQTLLDLMYDRQGPLIDNERLLAGYMGVSIRKWRVLRETLLTKGKIIVVEGGGLSNRRAEKEIENLAKTTRKLAENGMKGARTRIENEKKANENNEGDEAPLKQGLSHTRYQIPEVDKKEEREGGGKPPSRYQFSGNTIRVTPSDMAKWQKTYHAIPDIAGELLALDAWFQDKPEAKRKAWFHTVTGALNRKHQEMLAAKNPANAVPWGVIV